MPSPRRRFATGRPAEIGAEPLLHPKSFRRSLALAVALPLVMMGVVAAVLTWQVVGLLSLVESVERTDRVIADANRAEKLLVDLETGVRGYLLTGKREFLEPRHSAISSIGRKLDDLERSVAESPDHVRRIADVRSDLATWLAFQRDLVDRKQRGADYLPPVAAGHGKRLMDAMRRRLTALVRIEEDLREARGAAAREAARTTAGLGLALSLLVAVALASAGRRQLLHLSGSYDAALAAERRHAEARRESDERFRLMVESVQDYAIFMLEPDGRVASWNAGAQRIKGYRAEDIVGRHFSRFYPVEAVEAGHPARELELAAADGRYEEEGWRVRADGSRFWASVVITAMWDEEGRLRGFAKATRDRTERRRAEEALRERERLFATFMNNSPAVAFMKDAEGRYVYVNEPFERAFHVRLGELQGRTDFEWLPADTATHLAANDRAVLASGRTTELLENVPTPDGAPHDWLAFKFPFNDVEGRRLLGGVAVDITERIRAEEEVRRMNAELEHRVRRRTAELEAANRELEAFSHSVSHDLRAPLRSILGFSQALLEDQAERLDDEGRGHLARVCAASKRMARLMDDLLELFRISRSELRREAVDLSALARDIVRDLRRGDPSRRVDVAVQDGLLTDADPRLLRVLLEKLLGNAWKFTSKRARGEIDFGALAAPRTSGGNGGPAPSGGESGPAGTVYFVRDNGAGFDMAYAGKLFAPFQRLHATHEFPGTGVGLALVQAIVRRHGGGVRAEGAVDRGATFFFTLDPTGDPAVASAPADTAVASASGDPAGASTPAGPGAARQGTAAAARPATESVLAAEPAVTP